MASVAGRRKRADTAGVDSSSGGGDISANTNKDSSLEVESASSPVLVASPPSRSTGPALEKLQFDSWDESHAFVREYEAQTYQALPKLRYELQVFQIF
ncbi:hypothetical protein GN244_ATG00083 [Phytophthora infestans]|uniref:Uncharacterized protein n=1 Tax=Phytophthora infestans TaxID=4787 RepID=A0A833TVA5_PHYIN|nr:hypothetical protein GN244_ATG00083 [Phytophthora infestans]